MKHIFTIILYFAASCCALSQGIIANQVVSFTPGGGQNSGQAPEYFPENIFKLPPETAGKNFQAADPKDICSIGLGGEIVLSFKDGEVIDGQGPDFTIFENAFVNPLTGKIFAEPAKVAVSEDGINFVEFPFDSLTLEGCAGTHWVNGKGSPFNPDESGGDQFDLADIGIYSIRYVKITDISRILLENSDHPFYDPIISGFDLDCVVGLNTQHAADVDEKSANGFLWKEENGSILIETNNATGEKTLEIYSLYGRLILKRRFVNSIHINLKYPSGIYFARIISGGRFFVKRIIL